MPRAQGSMDFIRILHIKGCRSSVQTKIRICANTPTNTTLLLALYCHPNNPVAGTVLLPIQIIIVPIYMRYINQLIALIRLLLQPDRQTSSTFNYYYHLMLAPYRYLNLTTVALICLRPKHNQVELRSLKYNPIASTVLLVLEYIDKGYMVTCLRIAVLRIKKELPVLEYMDRSYVVTYRQRVIIMSLISYPYSD